MNPLLEIENLEVTYSTEKQKIFAVQDFSLVLYPGETLGIVGESGCGKSSIFKGLFRLFPDKTCKVHCAKWQLLGEDLLSFSSRQFRTFLGKKVGWIPQDPFLALHPSKKIKNQMIEGVVYHKMLSTKEALERASDLLLQTGLKDPERIMEAYPHELSGGENQRVLLSTALSTHPPLLVADEPTTALDVVKQKDLLDLLLAIKKNYPISLIVISHDIGFLSKLCDRFVVMYAGEKIEEQPVSTFFSSPLHPYTQGLLRASFSLNSQNLAPIQGSPPLLFHKNKGCPFAPRCSEARQICLEKKPPLLKDGSQKVNCFNYAPNNPYEKISRDQKPKPSLPAEEKKSLRS